MQANTIFSIRKAELEDWPFVESLYAQEHVRSQMRSPSQVSFARAVHTPDCFSLIIERDRSPFGAMRMDLIEPWLLNIGNLAILVPRKGAGRFALDYAISHAFSELAVHRVFLEIVETNVPSRKLCEGAGFRAEGLYRDGYRDDDGSFHNLIPYGMLAADYEEGARRLPR